MDKKFRVEAPGMYWADVEDWGDHLVIADGYNCGQITARISFPTEQTLTTYLMGLWDFVREVIKWTEVELPQEPVGSDERIGKLARQFYHGLLTQDEFILHSMAIIDAELSESK